MSALIEEAPDLVFSGRDSNRNLSFRRWSASSHASYYTSNAIAEAIAAAVLHHTTQARRSYDNGGHTTASTASHLHVFDPTCGSGRLLVPFKAAGAQVLGIELDEDAAAVAKKNLLSKNVRVGDLLLYRKILKGLPYGEGANVVVTNPPFGIWWNVSTDEGWETVNQHGSVESQAFTLELCTPVLQQGGLLVAIVPSSSFENAKDTALRTVLYKHYDLQARITIDHAFTEEYGLDVQVDIVVARKVYQKYGSESRDPKRHALDALSPMFAAELTALLMASMPSEGVPLVKPMELPQVSLLVKLPIDTNVTITEKSVTGGLASRAMLDFLNASTTAYSPVQGVRTGVIDAFCSTPALIKRGWDTALRSLRDLGFTPDISKATADRLERKRTHYDRLAIPLYRPKAHQLLGYFDDKPYAAIADVSAKMKKDPETANIAVTDSHITLDPAGRKYQLWQNGRSYAVHPTWIRKKETASEETTFNEAKDRDETTRVEIERGYLLLEVETDVGTLHVPEIDEAAVALFLKAFPLPEIEDVGDLLTQEVERNRALLATQSPYLLDYQAEDVARLVTKPRGYIGWEVGGGKTCSSIAWAKARQYRRVLVVCESRLVENWLAECTKFGVEGHRLTTHASVANLRARIRAGEKPTGFYITSYEFLSLDGSKTFEPWDCVKYDKDGNVRHEAKGITSEACDCGSSYQLSVKACPKCESSEAWSGQSCRACGFVAYMYNGERRQRPAYKSLSKLFPCVIADEAQVAKSKLSLRGQALRSLKSKGLLILTATIFKGYVTDLFWLVSFVLRWNNPLFPYAYGGGAKRFLDCYATYKFVTREFEDTLHTGKAQLLPEVSSLNLFARMMAPFMVRRVDGEMAVLPPKHRHVHRVPMTRVHAEVYDAWEQWATDRIRGELARNQGADVNMGVISQSLWAMRFAASVPTAADHLAYPDGPNRALPPGSSWSKLDTILSLVRGIIAKGEKVIVTSPLRPMVKEIALRLRAEGIPFTSILASTNVDARHGICHLFNHDATPVLLASMGAICRGLNITGANHIIVAAVEWSPEPLTQVCGRIHRPGQLRECHEHIVLSAGTIDDDMFELCNAKYAALKEAIDAESRYKSVAEILQSANASAQLEVARKVASRPRAERPLLDIIPVPVVVPEPPVVIPPIPTTATQINLF